MKVKFVSLLIVLIVVNMALVNSQFGSTYSTIGTTTQYYNPSFSSGAGYTSPSIYWPDFDKEVCRERQDFIIQVAPGGCQPAVVRSDLLEERNVPVFCKLMLIQANPLVDVSRVKSIRFSGKPPEGVAGMSYFPSRFRYTNRRDLADTPLDDNMGYFVVNLKTIPSEDDMPDWVGGNLTAVIHYDVENALGIGKTYFYASEIDNEEWLRDYKQYSFWNGKAYLRVESVEKDRATVAIYRDMDTRRTSVTLKKGETSDAIYLPGFYCAAGLKVRLEDIQAPLESALLQVDNQQIWVARGDRILDNKCSVTDVDTYAGGGKVSLSCSVKNGRFDLRLNPGKITLELSEDGAGWRKQDYGIGEGIYGDIYLGYAGSFEEKGEKKRFAVLVSDPWSGSEIGFADKNAYAAVEKVINEDRNNDLPFTKLEDKIKAGIVSEYRRKTSGNKISEKNVTIIKEKTTTPVSVDDISVKLSEVKLIENKNWELEDNASKLLAYEYYKEAIKNYEELVDLYPQEKRIEEDYFEPYAAEGLFWASRLAKDFNMSEDQEEFLNKLRRDYPDSAWSRKAESDKERLLRYDSSESRAVVNFREGGYFIEVLDFDKPGEEELSADLIINGKSERLGLDEVWETSVGDVKTTDRGSVQVIEIDEDYVRVKYDKVNSRTGSKTVKLDLDRNKQTVFEDVTVKLMNINLKRQAKVSLDSTVRGPRAYANFSFRVGIEKRGIDLSPEKTVDLIADVQETIGKWENINEKLGKVVKSLKGACFATSAMLTVKNLFGGFGGESLARKEVMTRVGGWNDYCEKIVNSGELAVNGKSYSSVEKCLLDHNSNIEKDIGIYAKHIEDTNKKLEEAREGLVKGTGILDFEGQVQDRVEMENRFKKTIKPECEKWGTIELPKKGDQKEYFNPYDEGFCDYATFDNMKEVSTLYDILNDPETAGPLKDMARTDLARVTSDAKRNHDWEVQRIKAKQEADERGLGVRSTLLPGDSVTHAHMKTITDSDKAGAYSGFSDLKKGDKVVRVFIPTSESFKGEVEEFGSDVAGHSAIVKLSQSGTRDVYQFEQAYTIDGQNSTKIDEDVQRYLSLKKATQFKESNAAAYENRMINVKDVRVKYFDKVPYKGLPAEIPFDIERGWYVEFEYVLSGFGKPYDESGRAINYYICNVGNNGLIEFKRNADDICRYYNGVSDELGFPGMDLGQSRQLVSRARNAVAEAVRYYGKTEAIISGQKFKTGTSFGGEAGKCTDFMSPQDCNIMFNLCDPVICPSSRCDLGGEFPVDNVIQTGIIGSLVLCLPNIKEGVMMPVCLSGVHAGIEGYLSILKAEEACLNESLETGRNIGICDEVTSIYLCEFFWKQLVPFADVLIPKLIESFFKQGARGGGEYLTVQAAWDNTQSAIDYFRDEYAVNSMKAFNLRSTEEAGSEVCKAFVSTRFPTDFDLLTEPDSPVQYHAWFDENVMTTATPYPTSHYKVYFHIYSGNDQGVYYIVYLKDVSEEFSSYYTYTPEHYVVKRGYLAKGASIDEAKDFTAPSGYKKLCVNINGKDECDFGKVSTSFAINYLSDKYAEDQASQTQITRSGECVAGSPSMWSLAQPNVQAGAEEFVEPELYNQGINRVCSTYNPGNQVDARGEYDFTNSTYDRWKDVGYCDEPTIRCWLDTNSVKDVIKNKNLTQQVLDQVDTSAIAGKDYLTPDESIAIANKAENLIEESSTERLNIAKGEKDRSAVNAKIKSMVEELNELAYISPSNAHRARGFFLLGKLYGRVAKMILGSDDVKKPNKEEEQGAKGLEAGQKPASKGEANVPNGCDSYDKTKEYVCENIEENSLNRKIVFKFENIEWKFRLKDGGAYFPMSQHQNVAKSVGFGDFPGDDFCYGIEYMINVLKCFS
jgi:hypothetical protein